MDKIEFSICVKHKWIKAAKLSCGVTTSEDLGRWAYMGKLDWCQHNCPKNIDVYECDNWKNCKGPYPIDIELLKNEQKSSSVGNDFLKEIIKDIEYMLNAASHKGFTRTECHSKMQFVLKELCKKYGYNSKIEYWATGGGALDVAWFSSKPEPEAIFEIDSSIRTKSIVKLLNTEAHHKFWIYYGKDDPYKFLSKFKSTEQIRIIHSKINFGAK